MREDLVHETREPAGSDGSVIVPANEVANTDRELWREREGDYYADSIHVTKAGGIGIDVGGTVIVMPLRQWFSAALACGCGPLPLPPDDRADKDVEQDSCLNQTTSSQRRDTTMSTDIVERLRELERVAANQGARVGFVPNPLWKNAADEIERLRSALRLAEGVLANAPDFETTNDGAIPLTTTKAALAEVREALAHSIRSREEERT